MKIGITCHPTYGGSGAVANFRPVKRIPDVVEVFARIAREVPSRLVLGSDGP